METKVESLEGNKVKVTVTVGRRRYRRPHQENLQGLRSQVQLPGIPQGQGPAPGYRQRAGRRGSRRHRHRGAAERHVDGRDRRGQARPGGRPGHGDQRDREGRRALRVLLHHRAAPRGGAYQLRARGHRDALRRGHRCRDRRAGRGHGRALHRLRGRFRRYQDEAGELRRPHHEGHRRRRQRDRRARERVPSVRPGHRHVLRGLPTRRSSA